MSASLETRGKVRFKGWRVVVVALLVVLAVISLAMNINWDGLKRRGGGGGAIITAPEMRAMIGNTLGGFGHYRQEVYPSIRRQHSTSVHEVIHSLMASRGDFNLALEGQPKISAAGAILGAESGVGAGIQSALERVAWGMRFRPGGGMHGDSGGEAHFGQYLWYLHAGGVSVDHPVRIPGESESTGRVADLTRALAEEVNSASDLTYALPVLMAWDERDRWTNRLGEEVSWRGMLRRLLDGESDSQYCFGGHYRLAVAVVAASTVRDGEFGEVKEEARRRLGEYVRQAEESMDDSGVFRLPMKVDEGGIGDPTEGMRAEGLRLSHQAHTVEWLSIGLTEEQIAGSMWFHQAARALLDMVRSADAETPYSALCHAVHGLSLYGARTGPLVNPALWREEGGGSTAGADRVAEEAPFRRVEFLPE